jgi:hypothetical protein
MELVTSARVVCRSRPQVAALMHVCDLIASCLAPPKSWTIETAIRHGCVHLTRHLLNELADEPELYYLLKRWRARLYLSVAASVGDISLMEHLVERFGCSCDDSAVREVVEGGHLESLQWLYDQALIGLTSGDDVEAFKKRILSDHCMILASRVGHLEMLQWMHSVTKRACVDLVLRDAVRCGHLHILEWILPMVKIPKSNMTKLNLTEAVMQSGSLEVPKFLHSKSLLPLTSNLMDAAARNGKLEQLKWMSTSAEKDAPLKQSMTLRKVDTLSLCSGCTRRTQMLN